MANKVPELIPVYIDGVMTPENVTNIEAAIAVIYANLPKMAFVPQATIDAMAKLGDRREKEAKATVKVLKASPNLLFAPLTPTLIDNSLQTNDQAYLVQLDVDALALHIKRIVDVTGGQGSNWAIFAKHTLNLLAQGGNENAKLIFDKLTQALKAVEQEIASGQLSKTDKALLKEAKDAKAASKLK